MAETERLPGGERPTGLSELAALSPARPELPERPEAPPARPPAGPADTLPPRAEALVRAAWVLTVGPAGDVEDGAVHVRDGEIVAVGRYAELRAELPAVPVFGDGTGLLIPGLVDAHTRMSEALLSGLGSELMPAERDDRIAIPTGCALTVDDARAGTKLRAVELLLSGVTTVNDLFTHSNRDEFASLGVVEGLRDAGLRGLVAFGPRDAVPGDAWADVARILAEHRELARVTLSAAAAGATVGFRYGVGAPLDQSDELLEAGIDACRSRGWAVHARLAETREELAGGSLRWGRRTVAHVSRLGLFEAPTLAAHGVWLTEDDVAVLVDASVAIAHTPVSDLALGAGTCPVPRLLAAGVPVGIATGGATGGQDMLQAVRMAALAAKGRALDPAVLSVGDVLRMATLGGARALGLDHLVGSLEPGKRADLVLLQDTVCVAVLHDPGAQLVHGASPRAVRDVWVDGRRVVADHACVTIHEHDQIVRARVLASYLAAVSGLSGAGLSRLPATRERRRPVVTSAPRRPGSDSA